MLRAALLVLFLGTAPAAAQTAADAPPDRWLAPDKPAHVFAGYWTAGAGWAATDRLGADGGERAAAALAAAVTAGLAKEAFDALVQGERFSWKDLAADMAGMALFLAAASAAP